MTDEEQQKFINDMRECGCSICLRAADEIERLAALAQSDARLRCLITGNPCGTDTWEKNTSCKCANCQTWLTALAQSNAAERPNASAGLIEAAEWHEKQIAFYRDQCRKADADLNIDAVGRYDAKRAWHESSAKYFRARAADRSGK